MARTLSFTSRAALLAVPSALIVLCGCYDLSHRRRGAAPPTDAATPPPDAPSCRPELRPRCVSPPVRGCDRWELAEPECDASSLEWRCPAGARVYAREDDSTAWTPCLPFSRDPRITSLGGPPVHVPTDDGRCLWVFGGADTPDGHLPSAGVLLSPEPSFGACPSGEPIGGAHPVPVLETDSGAPIGFDVLLDPTSSVRPAGGPTRVSYRAFVLDASGGFGVRLLGSGLGVLDAGRNRIVVSTPPSVTWPPEQDIVDALLDDGGRVYAYGCPGEPTWLVEDCIVARLDETLANPEFFDGRGWSRSLDDAAPVVHGGPWRSAFSRLGSGALVHVFAAGFGTDLQLQTAAAPEGPWSPPTTMVPCELPPDDPEAFCGYPQIHEELADPTEPDVLVVSYGLGTLAADGDARRAANPEAYWPRVVRARLP